MTLQQITASDIASWDSLKDIADSFEKQKERAFEEVKEEFSPSQTRFDEKDWVGTDEEDNDEDRGKEGDHIRSYLS